MTSTKHRKRRAHRSKIGIAQCVCDTDIVVQVESHSDVVTKYVATLLKTHNLPALFKMSSHCKFPLLDWLKRHRFDVMWSCRDVESKCNLAFLTRCVRFSRGSARVGNYLDAYQALQERFGLGGSENLMVLMRLSCDFSC